MDWEWETKEKKQFLRTLKSSRSPYSLSSGIDAAQMYGGGEWGQWWERVRFHSRDYFSFFHGKMGRKWNLLWSHLSIQFSRYPFGWTGNKMKHSGRKEKGKPRRPLNCFCLCQRSQQPKQEEVVFRNDIWLGRFWKIKNSKGFLVFLAYYGIKMRTNLQRCRQ